MADAQSNIKVSIDTTEALASIKNLQRQISAFHTSMAKSGAAANAVTSGMQQNLLNSINATGKFSAQMKTIRTTTESFTNSLEKNKFSIGEYFRYAGGASKTFGKLFKTEFDTINKVARENVKDLQTQYIKMGRDANGSMKAIAVRPLSLDMQNLATKTMIASEKQALLNQLLKQGSTNLLNFGKNTQWAGRQLMVGFTIPLIALGSAASKTFMEMETQAIRFRKVYGDLFTPASETQAALDGITELGRQFTRYGVAVSSTVGLAAEAAAAGFKGLDLQRQTTAATKLSILGQVDSQKALETTIALQNAFSMSSEDLAGNIDFLNAVENQTVLSLDDVSTAIPKAAPVIQQLGGDVRDLAFFMTAMKEGGINASEGANALKSGLASMINPTGKASAMLEGFGINIKKIVVDNKGDLKKTVIDFATALNQLDPLNRAQAIEQMFGKFQFARLSTLFANVTKEGTQASRVLDLAGSSVQDLASLSEKELGMTSESAMVKFRASVENLKLSLVPVGEEFLKAVTPIAEFVSKILDKFNNLGDGTKKIIVTLTAVIAGLGPVLLMTFGLLANGVANIIKGFTAMKTLFNKAGQSSATLGTEVKYMTLEQRNAASVAASLDQVHKTLAQTFTAETSAVNKLTAAYERSIAAQRSFMPTSVPLSRGPIKKRAKGKPAVVGGTGNKDSELNLLQPGETVIPTDMSKKYGALINGMIADNIPGYKNGKPASGNRSMYGGQERILAPYTMMAPGNKPGGFGMDEAFLASDDFAKSLTNTAAAAGSIEGKIRLTDKSIDELANLAQPYSQEITDQLRIASKEMAATGKSATHISELFDKKRKEIDSILSRMSASGSQGAAMARGLQVTAYPTDTDIRTGGNVRVPGVDVDPQGNVVRAAPRSVRTGRASQFQTKIGRITSRRPLDTQERITRAHVVPEARVLAGGVMPLGGGALGLPEEQQRAARLELEKRNIKLSQQLGIQNAKAYDSGVKSVKIKDPYEESRNRKSPHRLAAQDGKDDAIAYSTAVEKSIARQNRKLAKQGNSSIAGNVAGGTTLLAAPSRMSRVKGAAGKVGSKFAGKTAGLGMAGSAAMMAGSFLPGKAGQIAQAAMPVAFGLQALQMALKLPIPHLKAIAAVALVTYGAFKFLNSVREKERLAIEGLGDAALVSEKKLKTLGDFFGIVPTKIDFLSRDNVVNNTGVNTQQQNAIDKLQTDKSFQKEFKNDITSLKKSTDAQAKLVFDSMAIQLRGSGFAKEQIDLIIKALQEESGKTSFKFDFANIDMSTDQGILNFDKNFSAILKDVDKAITQTVVYARTIGQTNQVINQFGEGARQNIKLAADAATGFMNGLRAQLENGIISADQFNQGFARIKSSIATMPKPEQILVLNAVFKTMPENIQKAAAGLTNAGQRMDILQAQALGLTGAALSLASAFKTLNTPQVYGPEGARVLYNAEQEIKRIKKIVADTAKAFETTVKTGSGVTPNPYVDPDTGGAGGKTENPYLKILQKEIDALKAKRDAQKAANDEIQRQIDLEMKLQDLSNQAVQAKISGNYIQAAMLSQESKNVQMEFNKETELKKKDAEIDRLEARYQAIKDGAKLTSLEKSKIPKKANGGLIKGPGTGRSDSIKATMGYAGGGSIRVSNGEFIVKAASVRDYGLNAMNAVNNGTADITTNSGGTVYNINMPITSNSASPEGVANEVMRRLKVELNKNNKSNAVRT
jgi:TP901 family phage tail tape measure protein